MKRLKLSARLKRKSKKKGAELLRKPQDASRRKPCGSANKRKRRSDRKARLRKPRWLLSARPTKRKSWLREQLRHAKEKNASARTRSNLRGSGLNAREEQPK